MAANLRDTRLDSENAEEQAQGIPNEDLFYGSTNGQASADYYKAEIVDANGSGADTLIKISVKDLKYHQNGGIPTRMGYWVGVKITGPTEATHVKVGNSATSASDITVPSSAGELSERGYYSVYLNAGDPK